MRILLPTDLYLHVPNHLQPLANNSGYSFVYSLLRDQTLIKEKKYFNDKELEQIFSIERNYSNEDSFSKKNVVIFILESFSNDLLYQNGKTKAYTPFLDSLMKNSTTFTNSYANAFESNKGIVAILGSLPTFTAEPFYYSNYANNKIKGLGHILTTKNYKTSFFMGANYDHFGFAKWCKMIGIQNYYSLEDYPLKNHFDGHWGISDHYFLPYVANIIKQQKPPFFSTIFNLSSHYPFIIPKEIKPHFTIPNQGDQQNAVSYVDYSIRLFFESIKQEEWYSNTIFVFTADHSAYYQKVGLIERTEIPIFFHIPANESITIKNPVQQIDIVPTILDLLNYDDSFNSFGYSAFDTSHLSQYAFFKAWDNYYIRDTSYLLCFSEIRNSSIQLFDIKKDRSLQNNLINNEKYAFEQKTLERNLKAFLQRYTSTLVKNKFNE